MSDYGTIAEADSYLASNSTWLALTDAQKTTHLTRAEAYLDALDWKGDLADSAQTIAWPRTGVLDKEGRTVDEATVPDDITSAFFECAALDLAGTLYANADTPLTSKTVTAGSVSVSKDYAGATSTAPAHGNWVQNLIEQYLNLATANTLLRA